MDYINTATPERSSAPWRRPLRGWISKRPVAARPVAAAARIGFVQPLQASPADRADDPAPFDGDELLRRLREAGL